MTGPVAAGFPPVHCVVLNYGGWRDTIACLESLLRSDYPVFRVVVVDNASPGDSVERIVRWARGEEAAAVPDGPLSGLVSPPAPKPVALSVVDGTPWATPRHAEPWSGNAVRGAAEGAPRVGAGFPPAAVAGAAAAPLTLLRAPGNHGFTGGNNVALRYLIEEAAPGYVWLLNNDTLVAPDAISRLIDGAQALARCGAVGATLLEYGEPSVVQEAAGGTVTRWHGMVRPCEAGSPHDALPGALRRLDYVSGCAFLVPLAVVREVGLLDERIFMYAEDIDWSVRIADRGYALGWAREARVWHKGGASAGRGSPVHDYHNVRSSLLFVRKHHPRLVPLALAYVLYRAVLPKLVRREWSRLIAVRRGVRDFFRERGRMGAPT